MAQAPRYSRCSLLAEMRQQFAPDGASCLQGVLRMTLLLQLSLQLKVVVCMYHTLFTRSEHVFLFYSPELFPGTESEEDDQNKGCHREEEGMCMFERNILL